MLLHFVVFVLCASLKNDSFSFLQKNDDDDDDLKARKVVIIVISDYDLQLQSNACTECSEN